MSLKIKSRVPSEYATRRRVKTAPVKKERPARVPRRWYALLALLDLKAASRNYAQGGSL